MAKFMQQCGNVYLSLWEIGGGTFCMTETDTIRALLTPKQRLVCAAYWYDGLTYSDIARMYGMRHKSAARNVIARALRKLTAAGICVPPGRSRPTSTKRACQLSVVPAFLIP